MGGDEPPNKLRNIKSSSPKHSSDVEMIDLDRGMEMEWEQTINLTPEQAVRLILMKEKAVRIGKARLQRRVLLEELSRKQEKESNYVELESWIWASLITCMESANQTT